MKKNTKHQYPGSLITICEEHEAAALTPTWSRRLTLLPLRFRGDETVDFPR